MEKSKLYLLPLCFLVLSACTGNNSESSGKTDAEKLSTPVVSLNADRNGLSWDAVDGAVSYAISVNDEEAVTVTEPGYLFEEEAGQYDLKIVAQASDAKKNSDAASFEYSTLYTQLADLVVNETTITFASYVGAGVSYSIDGGEQVAVTGNSITITDSGLYTVRALAGFKEDSNKFYVDNASAKHEKAVLIAKAQNNPINLELGDEETDTDLQEKYVAKKYSESGWVDTPATLVLESSNPFGHGNAVKANIWRHSAWFKWTSPLEASGRIESLNFIVKGAPATRFGLSFEVTEDLLIGGLNLKGVYASYLLEPAPETWTRYQISVDDAAWKVNFNGSSYPFATVQTMLANMGYNINSVGDFFPYFGNYQIKAYASADSTGSTTAVYFDDVTLGVEKLAQTTVETFFEVPSGEYAFKSTQINAGKFTYNPDGESLVEFTMGGSPVQLPVTTQVGASDKSLTLTCTTVGYDFVAKFLADSADAKSFTLDTVTGSAAAFISGMKLDRCKVLFDFENFTSTGIGYDQHHTDSSAWSELRKEFYSDYYSGTSGSSIGGNGWSMMGSNDYLDLATDVCHSGSKSMRLKYNASNQMRFLTFNLYTGDGAAYEEASYLSMWVRACTSRDNVLKVKAFYIPKVEPATQSKCLDYEVTIPADSSNGWVEVKVPLNAGTSYYGFGILPMKNNGDGSTAGNKYFYVDDIALYNTISPFINE